MSVGRRIKSRAFEKRVDGGRRVFRTTLFLCENCPRFLKFGFSCSVWSDFVACYRNAAIVNADETLLQRRTLVLVRSFSRDTAACILAKAQRGGLVAADTDTINSQSKPRNTTLHPPWAPTDRQNAVIEIAFGMPVHGSPSAIE